MVELGSFSNLKKFSAYWQWHQPDAAAIRDEPAEDTMSELMGTKTPRAPYNLVTEDLSDETSCDVGLTWLDRSGEDNFEVHRSTDDVTYSKIATLSRDTESYVDQNVTCDTTYYYKVRGTNDAGAGSFTSSVQMTPSSGGGA